jgi:hypothetical protein
VAEFTEALAALGYSVVAVTNSFGEAEADFYGTGSAFAASISIGVRAYRLRVIF